MRLVFWIADLWPGFVQAWLAARWEGLALAAAFAAALNFAIVTSFVWPDMYGTAGGSTAIAWFVVLGFWIVGFVWLRRDASLRGRTAENRNPQIETWFCQAQHEYLKGHWIEAESLITRLLGQRPHDVEAGLLLAAVQRRTERWREATETLNNMKGNSASAAWSYEIETELGQIRKLEAMSGNWNERETNNQRAA
jgi:hypothetical protein